MTRRRLIVGVAVVCVPVVLAACHRQAPSPASSMPDGIVTPYLAVHDALVRDSLDLVGGNAAAIADAARAAGATPVESAATALKSATTLADARDRFGALSEAVVAYAGNSGRRLPNDVRQAYCPMLKRPWLQRGAKIANPYYGKEMPDCGEFK